MPEERHHNGCLFSWNARGGEAVCDPKSRCCAVVERLRRVRMLPCINRVSGHSSSNTVAALPASSSPCASQCFRTTFPSRQGTWKPPRHAQCSMHAKATWKQQPLWPHIFATKSESLKRPLQCAIVLPCSASGTPPPIHADVSDTIVPVTPGALTHTWLAQSLTNPPCEASPIPAVATSSSGCDMAANRFITATILSFDCIKVSHSARGVCSGATVSCGRSAMTVAAALPALHTPTWPRQPASPSPPPPHGKATHALQRCCGLIRPRSAPWKGGCSFPVVCVA